MTADEKVQKTIEIMETRVDRLERVFFKIQELFCTSEAFEMPYEREEGWRIKTPPREGGLREKKDPS